MAKLWRVISISVLGLFVSPKAAAQKPNIVLIIADDLDADEIRVTAKDTDIWPTHTGAAKHGFFTKPHNPDILTPHIDKLREEGVLLTNFHVSATQCTASRYTFLTGRQATRGADLLNKFPAGTLANLGWDPGMLREETNVAKSLKEVGYRTGIIGKWHNIPRKANLSELPKKVHEAQATYKDTLAVQKELKEHYDEHVAYLREGYGWDSVDRMEWGNSIVNLPWQCEGALKFIDESSDQPFFLYVALPVPHGQYRYSYNNISGFDNRVTSRGIITDIPNVMPSVSDVYARTEAAGVSRKYAMATWMDDYVGAILQKLDGLGLNDNTLFIFTSDHASRGKNSGYEGGAHVPFIARWPQKIPPNTKSDSLIASVDVASTLVDVAGGTSPEDMRIDGSSFKQMLLGESEPDNWREHLIIEAQTTRAVVTKKWSYIANRITPKIAKKMAERPGKVFWSGGDTHNYQSELIYPGYWDADQLYDLENDHYQQVNVVADGKHKAILRSLRAKLDRYIATLPHSFGEFGTGVYSGKMGTVVQSVNFMKTEGYVEGALALSSSWAGQLEPYTVQPDGKGYLRLPDNPKKWQQAVLKVDLPLSDTYEVVLDFTFVRTKGVLDNIRTILVAEIKEKAEGGNGNGRLGIALKRTKDGDKYVLQLVDTMSTQQRTASPTLNEDLLGFKPTNSSTSEKLRLGFYLERGSDRSDWTFIGTLFNLDQKKVVSELRGKLDSSQAFFEDGSLFACINSANSQDSSLSYYRDIDKVTVRASGSDEID